jgi:regulator of RNase E activity RraA
MTMTKTVADALASMQALVLQARPGDTVVLRATRPVSADVADQIITQMADYLPPGVQCIVLDGLILDGVIRPKGVPE